MLIPVLGFGRTGGFRVLSKLAEEWARLGLRPTFLAPCWSDPPYFPTSATIKWVDESGRQTERRPSTAPRGSLGSFLALAFGIARHREEYSAILATHSLTAWPIALAPTKARKVYYVQAYEPEYYANKAGALNRVRQFLSWGSYFLPLRRIVNAPLYLNYGACRSTSWIPPGLDLTVFHPKTNGDLDRACKPAVLTVGCIGRAEPEKGTALAISAYRLFSSTGGCSTRFRIADFGVPPALLADIPRLERVVPSNDCELAAYYRSLDVLLALGTLQHGAHHYPVMEAMACGVAVVTTGYMPADNLNAWIVGPTPAAAAKALEDIRGHPEMVRQKSLAAQQAIQRYAWPEVGRAFAAELTRHVRREA